MSDISNLSSKSISHMASLREKKEEPIDKLEIVVYRLFLREIVLHPLFAAPAPKHCQNKEKETFFFKAFNAMSGCWKWHKVNLGKRGKVCGGLASFNPTLESWPTIRNCAGSFVLRLQHIQPNQRLFWSPQLSTTATKAKTSFQRNNHFGSLDNFWPLRLNRIDGWFYDDGDIWDHWGQFRMLFIRQGRSDPIIRPAKKLSSTMLRTIPRHKKGVTN